MGGNTVTTFPGWVFPTLNALAVLLLAVGASLYGAHRRHRVFASLAAGLAVVVLVLVVVSLVSTP